MNYLIDAYAAAGDGIIDWLAEKGPWFFGGLLLGLSPTIVDFFIRHLSIHWR